MREGEETTTAVTLGGTISALFRAVQLLMVAVAVAEDRTNSLAEISRVASRAQGAALKEIGKDPLARALLMAWLKQGEEKGDA